MNMSGFSNSAWYSLEGELSGCTKKMLRVKGSGSESAGESGTVSPQLERKRSASLYVLTASFVARLPAAIMKPN